MRGWLSRVSIVAFAATLAVLSINVAPAFAGTVVTADAAFGTAGVAKDPSMSWFGGTQPAVLANNTYFVGGYKSATPGILGVDAYTLNGQPVSSYGSAGDATVNTSTANFFASGFTATSATIDDIGADSLGRVSLAGYATNGTTIYLFVLRFTTSGALDTTFATGGVYAAATIGSSPAGPAWIDTNPDGTSAVRVDLAAAPYHYFFKLTAAGVFDPTYGTAGLASPTCTGVNINPWIDLQSGGDLFTDCFTSGGDLQIIHLLADGSQDPTFGTAGFTQIPDNGLGVSDLVDRPGGGYYVAGLRGHDDLTALTGAAARPMIAAINANGTVDTSFGTGGVTVLPASTLGTALSFSALTLDSTGRLLVLASGHGPASYLLRYLPNGTLDTSFGDSAGYEALPGGPAGWTAAFISAASATTVVAYQATGLRRFTLTDSAAVLPTTSAQATLPNTGAADMTPLTTIAVGLIIAGSLLLALRRRYS
jgi:uncharacterized delta-60 repeat protein/LPXTG-motif cell wall-anchored protein